MAAKKPARSGSGEPKENTAATPAAKPARGKASAGRTAAARPTADKAAGGAGGAGGGAASRKAAKPAAASARTELQEELRGFIEHHPDGWGHDEWVGLLHHLRQRGLDAGDEARVGVELEKERLAHTLEARKVSGLGAARVRGIVDRFGTLWSLRQASVEEIEAVSGVNRQLAERVHEAVR